MSNFKVFAAAVNARFKELSAHELFVAVTPRSDGKSEDEIGEDEIVMPSDEQPSEKDLLWTHYLASFPTGTNQIYRVSNEYECSTCSKFVKSVGNVVAIIDGAAHTVWDLDGLEYPYNVVAQSMREYVLSKPVSQIFRRNEPSYGSVSTKQVLENGETITWNHFHGKIKAKCFTQRVGHEIGMARNNTGVFKRGLDQFRMSDVDTVLDLIDKEDDSQLYRGKQFRHMVVAFKNHMQAYAGLRTEQERQNYVMQNYESRDAGFRNTMIGGLFVDLAEGKPLEDAVALYESNASSGKYKRTAAVITQGMSDAAMKTIIELGLEPELYRRHANIGDLTINNVLWANNIAKSNMKGGIAGLLAAEVPRAVRGDKATEISIKDFMNDVLPTAKSIDMMVNNRHAANFVSVTAPVHATTNNLFQWNNGFAWSYQGNVTDTIRERVKRAGGNVEAKMRFSLAWFNTDDLDLYCEMPSGEVICFHNKRGILDVDANSPQSTHTDTPVENMAFQNVPDGRYKVWVHQYTRRNTENFGFEIQLACGSRSETYSYSKPVEGNVGVGNFWVKNGLIETMELNHRLAVASRSTEVWGVDTEVMIPVKTIMYSPNYWDDNAVGNRHWFFILENCRNPEPTRGIYNEFLAPGLQVHRKVFEVLGNKTKCPVVDDQLSGLGFSETRRDSVNVVVWKDNSFRQYKINF